MEEAFDPYRKWLGIPPEEQPPNHYRLLGIALFEDDPDVISNAADRQMAHIRTYQTGKRAPLSQALLNELSAAKVCLLDPARKKAYDGELAARHARAPRAVAAPVASPFGAIPPAAVPMAGQPLPVGAPVVKIASPVSEPAMPRRTNGPARSSAATAVDDPLPIAVTTRGLRTRSVRRSSSTAAISAFAAVGLLILLVLFVALFFGGNGDATDNASGNGPRPPKKSQPDTGMGESPKPPPTSPSLKNGVGSPVVNRADGDNRPVPPVKPTTPAESPDKPPMPPSDADRPDDGSDADESPPKPSDAKPAPSKNGPSDDDDDAAAQGAVVERPPPPSPAAIDKAYRIVRKDFEPQLREAVEPEERFDVAQQIVERAAAADEPATKYALYLLVRNLGIQMASGEQACEAVDLLARHFAINAFELKRQALDDIAQFVTLEPEDYTHLLLLMQRTARDALAAENGDAAVALTRLAKATSLKVRNPKALKELPRLEDLLADVDRLAADAVEFDREAKGFDRNMNLLERDANDAAANLGVGRYWLLVMGDWPKALPYLAKGADPAWKDPATIDLASPQAPAEQIALADAWYALALRKGGLAAPRLFERAKMWYALARESAADAEKAAIDGKIAEVDKQLKALKPPPDPTATADADEPANGSKSDAATPDADADSDDDGPAFPD